MQATEPLKPPVSPQLSFTSSPDQPTHCGHYLNDALANIWCYDKALGGPCVEPMEESMAGEGD